MEGLVLSDLARDLLINIINIVILFVIVRALVYKPVKKFLEDRKERIAKEQEDAASGKAEAEQLRQKYEALLAQGREEKAALLKEAEKTAKETAAHIVATAEGRAEETIRQARETAQKEHDKALSSLEGEITELAFSLSEKMLAHEANDEDDRRIAEAFFAGFQEG
ncbi:MAG: F0F1 ATP synthase subunit B [Clostridia bacterium]|nr:F0F1 ATP synthase subunit B [Clostridia bacterium]